jgi:putative nucleotidyltransferase-like protein
MGPHGLPGSFWPSDRQKLLLRAVLLGGEEGAGAWRRLRPTFRLDDLEPASTALLALLHRQLERLGIDDPLLPRLRGIYRRTWYVNQLLLDGFVGSLRAVQEAAVDPLVVGGWELPAHYYGDLGLRATGALHLLVRPEDAATAEEALAGIGWSAIERSRHSMRLGRAGDDQCFLHRQLFDEFTNGTNGAEDEDLWDRAVEFQLGENQALALGPADELLSVCASGARTNVPSSIVWVADAAAVLAAAHSEPDWGRLVGQAHRLRATLRVRDALVFLRNEIGLPIPSAPLDELEAAPAHRREVFAHRAAGARLGCLGAPPQSLTHFLRVTADRPLPRALASLPSFLRDEWSLERRSQVPLHAARRSAARVARAARAATGTGGRK